MSALLSYILVSIVVVIIMLVIIGKLMGNRIGPSISTDAIIQVNQGTQAVLQITKSAEYDNTGHATTGAEGFLYILVPDANIVMGGASELLRTDGHISEFKAAESQTGIEYFGTDIEVTTDPIHPSTIFTSDAQFASVLLSDFYEIASQSKLTINSAISGVPKGEDHPFVLGFKLRQEDGAGIEKHETDVYHIRNFTSQATQRTDSLQSCIDAYCFSAYLKAVGVTNSDPIGAAKCTDPYQERADSDGLCPLKIYKLTVQLNKGHTTLPSNLLVFDAPFNLFIDGIGKSFKKAWKKTKKTTVAVANATTDIGKSVGAVLNPVKTFKKASKTLNRFGHTMDNVTFNNMKNAMVDYANQFANYPLLQICNATRSIYYNAILLALLLFMNGVYTGAQEEIVTLCSEIFGEVAAECVVAAGGPEDPLVVPCETATLGASGVCDYVIGKAFDYVKGQGLPLVVSNLKGVIMPEFRNFFNDVFSMCP